MTTKAKKTKVQLAIETVCHALQDDPDYWIAWEANIAMAFWDEVERSFAGRREAGVTRPRYMTKKLLHTCANNAASAFLRLLCTEKR